MYRAVLVSLLVGGCVSIPAFQGSGSGSGSGSDAAPAAFTPRIVGKAWRGGGSDGTVPASNPGMTQEGYHLDLDAVAQGELLLFLMTIDNGDMSQSFVSLPDGFTKIAEHRFGGSETQTMVVGWKLATATEPGSYTGTYVVANPVLTSGAAAILLVAISGVDQAHPIDDAHETDSGGEGPFDPVVLDSPGVITKGPQRMIVFAGGPNWWHEGGRETFTPGASFTTLAEQMDEDGQWDWGSVAVTYRYQAAAGSTGPLTAQFDGRDINDPGTHVTGNWWDVAFAIAPALTSP